MIKLTVKVLLAGLSMAALIHFLLIGFGNMDMTQMRLLVTYWKEYLVSIVIWAATYWAWRDD